MKKSIVPFLLSAIFVPLCGLQIATFGASPLNATVSATSDGLCWWLCAEAVLRERGNFRQLVAEVKASGQTEASLLSVERFLKVEPVPTFQGAIPFVHRGTHVIATLRYPAGSHAVVIVDVDERIVTYWNPNAPTQYTTAPTAEIGRRWVMGTIVK